MALTATEVECAKPGEKVRRLADGNGLFVEIKPNTDPTPVPNTRLKIRLHVLQHIGDANTVEDMVALLSWNTDLKGMQ